MTEAAPRPRIRIRALEPPSGLDLSEVWRYRELLWSFCSREMTVRHKQTLLGPAWLVLQPLLHAVVFAVFMHQLARVPSDGAPYTLFAYAGLLPWLFFANGVQSLSYGLMMNSHLVTRVYFPRIIIPISMVLVRLVDFAAAIVVFLFLGFAMGLRPTWRLALVPLLMIQAAVLTVAVGAWSSCLTSRFRDFGTLLPVLLQFGMFASPVIYPSSLVPEAWRPLYFLNPMAPVVEGLRASLLGRDFSSPMWLLSAVVTLAFVTLLLRDFSRMETQVIEAL